MNHMKEVAAPLGVVLEEELFKTQYLAVWNSQILTKKKCLEALDNFWNGNCNNYKMLKQLINEHFELIDDYNKVCNEKERYARAYLRMSESSEKLIDRYFETEKTFSEIINTLRSTDLDDYECCIEIAKIVGIYYERKHADG